ncbi:MAG TPA: response regulator [Chryseosolibacter sp.]|nr:response regulator [Chryseosolibacter sp.]
MNVLLVDDDQVFNILNRKILESLGITEVDVATNGAEALLLFNEYFSGTRPRPDLILLDINMPVMDGFGFLEAFNKMPFANKDKVKIVIVTSSLDPRELSRANAMGIEHVLTKPISKEQLIAAVLPEASMRSA